MRWNLLAVFVVAYMLSLGAVLIFPEQLAGGDFGVHASQSLGPEYPQLLHASASALGIPWIHVNAASVAALVTALAFAFGVRALVIPLLFSKLSIALAFSGMAPMFFGLAVLFYAHKTGNRPLGLVSGIFHRGTLAISAFMATDRWPVRIVLLALSVPILISMAGYLHYPTLHDVIWSITDWGIPLMFWALPAVMGERELYRGDYAATTLGFAFFSLFLYPGRFLMLATLFGLPVIARGFSVLGDRTPPSWKLQYLVVLLGGSMLTMRWVMVVGGF